MNHADGSGTFAPFLEPTAPVGLGASPNEPADFDHDGRVDAVVCNPPPGTVSILLGQGNGCFSAHQILTVGAQPRGCSIKR